MTEISIKELVATPDLAKRVGGWSQGTWTTYSHNDDSFPKPIRIAGVNFFRLRELKTYRDKNLCKNRVGA